MPSNYTTNYKLNQWERSDRVLMEDFNADNAKIDAALARKAEASALTALSSTVSGKADQSALAAKADASAVTALTKQVTSLDRAALRAEYGSYTGTGTYGENNAKVLSFTKLPVLLVVRLEGSFEALLLVRGLGDTSCSLGGYGSGTKVTVTWDSSTNRVSWYGPGAVAQMNESGKVYRYTAIY